MMKAIKIDGSRLCEKKAAIGYLAEIFEFDRHYVRNLDALWDTLWDIDDHYELRVSKDQLDIWLSTIDGYRVFNVIMQFAQSSKRLKVYFE